MASLLPSDWASLSVPEIANLTPVDELNWPAVNRLGITVYVKREELLHSHLAGNKFYKLIGFWSQFEKSQKTKLASFGGAYSNHLYALAAFGHALNIPTMAIVRGERPAQPSPTLRDLQSMGMQLIYVSRSEYKLRSNAKWLATLQHEYSDTFFIPEGGSGLAGAQGCLQWAKQSLVQCPQKPTALCVAAGTGTTAAGIAAADFSMPLHVYLALKGRDSDYHEMAQEICELTSQLTPRQLDISANPQSISLETNYHCGGYGKFPEYLRQFVLEFEAQTALMLDPVYTAKMFFGIMKMAEQGAWPAGSRILAFHTGGLQGRRGYHLDS